MKRKILSGLLVVVMVGVSGCSKSDDGEEAAQEQTISTEQQQAFLTAYANMADDVYGDTLSDAQTLLSKVELFVNAPSETTMQAAKDAWLNARESYLQSEIFRLSDGPIDAESGWVNSAYGALEGQLNAWPLDENMIDYTVDRDGNLTQGNIIDSPTLFTPEGGTQVDVTTITADAITALNENGGDANIASGYHAIEFLLWGQDQDYASFIVDSVTNGANVAGQRPVSDYTSAANANRRKAYLLAATQKLVSDLARVKSAWVKDVSMQCDTNATGCYRAALLNQLEGADASKNLDQSAALKTIFTAMGTFLKSELANERIAVAVLTPSEEDEHSCFSDNTHRDITQDFQGFKNIMTMQYNAKSYGESLLSLLSSSLKEDIEQKIAAIDADIKVVDDRASTVHFDYQIKEGSQTRQSIVDMKNSMRDLGDKMIDVGNAFGFTITDVTDPGETQI